MRSWNFDVNDCFPNKESREHYFRWDQHPTTKPGRIFHAFTIAENVYRTSGEYHEISCHFEINHPFQTKIWRGQSLRDTLMVQKSCATWGVLNPVNNSINQQTRKHQLVLHWALYDPRNNILRNFALHWEVLTGLQATWDDSTTRWRQRSSEITLSKSVKHSHLLWVHGSVICDFLEVDEKSLDCETQPLTFGYRFVKVKGKQIRQSQRGLIFQNVQGENT